MLNDVAPTMRGYFEENLARITLQPHVPVVVFCDTPLREIWISAFASTILNRVRFLEPVDAASFDPQENTLVIATNSDRWEALKTHNQLWRPKAVGMTVALAMLDRRLTLRQPGWENSGIHYEGMFRIAGEYAKSLEAGDYAEFGVFDGNTFCQAFHALSGPCRRFFAFDSFTGIAGAAKEEQRNFLDGQYSCNLPTFRQNMTLAAVDLSRVVVVPGNFQQSLLRSPVDHDLRAVSVAHIDTDVYEPALLALNYLSPVLRQGALLLFDDFDHMGASNQKGERRALGEWLQTNPSFSVEPYRSYGIFGRSFLFHRAA